ncbi:MAG: 4-hydroxy-tetrahydrodipicolinate synthase [Alphaproteobacteria bacterium]|nr:4-hydroxy-tetrahydrodipicolinate synthase [Alphaproteobacteria bacterium]
MFKGSLVALVTPFRDGKVDEKAFQEFVAWQIAEGTHGLVPCGTTGESPTLSHDEHDRVIELCIEVAKGSKVPVIAGTGSNSTAEAIRLTKHARHAGADAALVVTPYYNRPTQEGLYLHFKAIHDAVDLPIIIYHIPPRSAVNMTVDTMARLAKLPRIVGVKCATADLQRPMQERIAIGDDWIQLSGEDGTALPYLAQGGQGCISVTANVAPRLLSEMHVSWQKGDVANAMKINKRLMPLHEALFVETSPAPVKFAASLLGKCLPDCRLPLAPTMEPTRARVRTAMTNAGLLN